MHIFIGIAMGIFAVTRSSSLTGQAAGFLQRLGQTFRDVLVWKPGSCGHGTLALRW